MNIYIIGHRGSGKSTAARLAGAELGLEVVDLDEVLEAGEAQTCAEIIADSEPRFRRLEHEYLDKVRASSSGEPRIISLGGGFSPVPEDGVAIWLYRDGWQVVAESARSQLNPDDDFSDEVAWMVAEREPRWEAAAHLKLDVSRGRGPERTGRDLATMIGWLLELGESTLAGRTWMVPAGPGQLERAVRDARLLGVAGVEVRSDLLEAKAADALDVDILASLRTPEPEWLAALEHAAAIDIDISLLDAVLEAGTLANLAPRQLLLSWHPPQTADEHDERLIVAAKRLESAHPNWGEALVLKYAPVVEDYADLVDVLETNKWLQEQGYATTTLPQGARFAWTRPPLSVGHDGFLGNASNYLPVGLGPHRRRHTDNPVKTPLDLQGWLPHLAGPVPTGFEGLLGDPVEASQGDVWHRRAARDDGRNTAYVKIPCSRDQKDSSLVLQKLLRSVQTLGVRGLSVTSPLKRVILEVDTVLNPEGLSAANTLRKLDLLEWEATDTDIAGMVETLGEAEKRGVDPGTVAIIGRGGVSPAVLRAIESSNWQLVHHASGREGWTDASPDEVTMVVNATGDSDRTYEHPPGCEVWVDLHYSGVRPAPEGVRVHLNGDVFFDAQARAQRAYWDAADGANAADAADGADAADESERE